MRRLLWVGCFYQAAVAAQQQPLLQPDGLDQQQHLPGVPQQQEFQQHLHKTSMPTQPTMQMQQQLPQQQQQDIVQQPLPNLPEQPQQQLNQQGGDLQQQGVEMQQQMSGLPQQGDMLPQQGDELPQPISGLPQQGGMLPQQGGELPPPPTTTESAVEKDIDSSLQETVQELETLDKMFVKTMTKLQELALKKLQQQQQQQQQGGAVAPGLGAEYVTYSLEVPPFLFPPLGGLPPYLSPLDGYGLLPPLPACGGYGGYSDSLAAPCGLVGGGLGGGFNKKREAQPCLGCWGGGGGLPLGGYGYGAYPSYPTYPYGGYGGLGLSFYGRGGYYGLY